jgi:hypothetical protein
LKNFSRKRQKDAKNREKCGHFHNRRSEETRWTLRRRRTIREKEEEEELSSR